MMNVKLINKGTTGELLLIGRLDSSNAGDVEKIAMDTASRFDTVILNITDLEYASSAGLRVILKLRVSMENKGGMLYVKGASEGIMEIFEMTGFAGLLNFMD